MLIYVVLVCKCVLPPGDNPIAVNKYYYYIIIIIIVGVVVILIIHISYITAAWPVLKTVPVSTDLALLIHCTAKTLQTIRHELSTTAPCIRMYCIEQGGD